jgi:E3 ubiquitin-protein ligase MUL1
VPVALAKEPLPPVNTPESKLCCICKQYLPNRVYVPCGHVCCCSQCAPQLNPFRCPMCRAALDRIIPYYSL